MDSIASLLTKIKRNVEFTSNGVEIDRIPTGFNKLDKLICGIEKGDLISLGARSGMGKTAFALSLAKNITFDFKVPLLYFSLETTSSNLVQKFLSAQTSLSLHRIRTKRLDKFEKEILNVKAKEFEEIPLFIDDTPELSIEKIESRIKEMVQSNGIEVVIVDYLQLMTIEDKNSIAANREQHISIIIKKLKYIARFYGVAIVVLSQLSRALETRGGSKRPILYDFRESGAVEDDSDIVCMLYRPTYYHIDEWDDEYRTPTENQAELIVAKNRYGGLDRIRLKFVESFGKFDNLEEFEGVFEFVSTMTVDKENPFASSDSANDDDLDDNHVPF